MIYKFIDHRDLILLINSLFFLRITYKYLGFKQWFFIIKYSFFICLIGWEWCWSVGYSYKSENYHIRSIKYNYKQCTSNLFLHSIFNTIGDTSIMCCLFLISQYIIPNGLNKFNLFFWFLLVSCGIIQNIIFTLSGMIPITNTMSWAPLSFNSNCTTNLICWNSQQIWLYAPTIMYFIYLLNDLPKNTLHKL